MESNGKSTNAIGGIGFCGLLTIVFIALKLLGRITWSWFWVLSPLWIPVCLFILIVGIVVIIAANSDS
jgi:hypothetical protein